MSGGTTISTSDTKLEALQIQSSAYGVTIPLVYGVARVPGNMLWYGGFKAAPHTQSRTSGGKGGGGGVTQKTTTFTYSASVVMGLCEGAVSGINRIWRGKKVYTDGDTTALAQLGLTVATGAVGQAAWSYLSATYPDQAIAYSGITYVKAQDYDLGSSTNVDNHNFELVGQYAYATISAIGIALPDANPATIALDILTNARYGAGFPLAQIYNFSDWLLYCAASNFLLSPALTTQMQAGAFITALGKITNTAPVWTGSGLKMIPYGDVALSDNNSVYTPNVAPIYDLNDDDFTPSSSGDDPIRVMRKPQSDAYNATKVEFVNRDNFYNVEISEAKDSANIDAYGLRTAETISAHWICDSSVARKVAQTALQRTLYIRNTYTFNLPWTKALLEPMDIVTLTDTGLGFNKLPVRIIDITESENGDLTLTAEEFPLGVASAAIYSSQIGSGYQHNYNVAPGDVLVPFIFEAPIELTTTGLDVYAAVRGVGANWGGCRVWVSLDGNNYRDAGLLYGGARYGKLTGPIFNGTLPITINGGQLLSGSATDSSKLATLCYIGGASPEYLAYGPAALTGALTYYLTGLTRAAFGTSGGAHLLGDPFVRIDDAIAKSGPLDLSYIGQTIYFKFTSFNIYQAAEQSLAAVTAYPYSVTGAMAYLPPSNVTNFSATTDTTGMVKLAWSEIPDGDRRDYEIRLGATWATGVRLTRISGLDYRLPAIPAATYQYWIAARDAFLNYSPLPTGLSVTIAGPSAPVVSYVVVGTDELLSWTIPATGALADRYELRYGTVFATAVYLDTTKATSYRRKADYIGGRTYWVAAIDAAGNLGVPAGVSASISAPGLPATIRADIIDNNALIYWSAPSIGTLPVDRYEVRKGSSFASGTVIGSNGNSTFTAVFEQSAGTYTYWIAAIDSAGNFGLAISVSAYIGQPPDYLLRANIDSIFSGAANNCMAFNGGLLLPANVSETWSQHFVNNNFASPQAQITAGFPVYINPSLTSASYTELIDYGSVLPATTVTATLNTVVLNGTVTTACQISYKLAAGDAWTNAALGSTSVLIAPSGGFRYVQVTYNFSCTAGANLLKINALNVKLSIKQRSDNGNGTSAAMMTLVSGVLAYWTTVTLNYPFISADCPIVQANSPMNLNAIINYVGTTNPTTFQVAFVNASTGANVASIPFSWTIKGY